MGDLPVYYVGTYSPIQPALFWRTNPMERENISDVTDPMIKEVGHMLEDTLEEANLVSDPKVEEG